MKDWLRRFGVALCMILFIFGAGTWVFLGVPLLFAITHVTLGTAIVIWATTLILGLAAGIASDIS